MDVRETVTEQNPVYAGITLSVPSVMPSKKEMQVAPLKLVFGTRNCHPN